MLIDTGCTKIMVSADYLNQDCVDRDQTEKIMCVHGDMMCYPTARVKLQLGRWKQVARVVVAVPVLLGTDIYDLTAKLVLVTTRAQAMRDRDKDTEVHESGTLHTNDGVEDLAEDTNGGKAGKYLSESVEGQTTDQRREELMGLEPEESNPLQASMDEIKQWQAMDPTLAKPRKAAENEESEVCVGFYYQNGLLHQRWRPEGSVEGDVRTCKQLVLPQQYR